MRRGQSVQRGGGGVNSLGRIAAGYYAICASSNHVSFFREFAKKIFGKYLLSAEKNGFTFQHGFGMFALEINKILQATNFKDEGGVGTCCNNAK